MDSSESVGLKEYLTKNFRDSKYKNASLLDIYRYDSAYFNQLKKQNKLRADALQFIAENEAELIKAESIPTDGIRDFVYEQIIDKYIEKISQSLKTKTLEPQKAVSTASKASKEAKAVTKENISTKNQPDNKKTQNNKEGNSKPDIKKYPKLICPYDLEVLSCSKVMRVKYKQKKANGFNMPLYRCKICGRRYTTLSQFDDMSGVSLNDIRYINLASEPSRKERKKRPVATLSTEKKHPCFVYGANKVSTCQAPGCGRTLININVDAISKKGKHYKQAYRLCPNCGMLYVSFAIYESNQKYLRCKNVDDFAALKEEAEVKAEAERKRQEELKRKQQEDKIEKAHLAQLKKEQELKRKQEEEARRKKLLEQRRLDQIKLAEDLPKKTGKAYTHDNTIHVKDFVVRRNVFKCRHNDHKLQNVNAEISLINSKGEIVQSTVSAGYCPNCNIFFIMESTYENIKRKGTPICRVSDEKAYLKGAAFANGMKLAQQSILMQYGYNVSQTEGLTSARRRKILAVMIDNKILTKSDIIGYLDFFISQRQYQPKYELAISKWESDKEFVSDYRKGDYATYGVKGIYRKY